MIAGAAAEDSLARIEMLIAIGRYQDALAQLALVIRDHPDHCYALCLRAQAQLQLDRPELARLAAEAAMRSDPTAEWPVRLLSIAVRELGDPTRAVELATVSVRMEPDLWEPRAVLAIALSESGTSSKNAGSRQRARRVAHSAVRIAPDEPQPYFVVGLVADRMGRYSDAEAAYRQALRLDPQHAAARNNLSVILSRRRDYIGAARGFTEAAAGDSRLVIARRNVDYVVIRLVMRAQLVVLAATFGALAGPQLLGVPSHWVSFVAAVTGVLVIVWSVVRFVRATPRRLHRYLATMPGRDRLASAWVTLLCVSMLVLCVASAMSGRARWLGNLVACLALAIALVLNYLRATRRRDRPDRTRS
ncbi:MAG TPA: tetratricopeptide repeat protein [Propionibacteriaceae bacterium]|nr:tetratricopeptide repeat protein [Propionibacteriaceae bacterium]